MRVWLAVESACLSRADTDPPADVVEHHFTTKLACMPMAI